MSLSLYSGRFFMWQYCVALDLTYIVVRCRHHLLHHCCFNLHLHLPLQPISKGSSFVRKHGFFIVTLTSYMFLRFLWSCCEHKTVVVWREITFATSLFQVCQSNDIMLEQSELTLKWSFVCFFALWLAKTRKRSLKWSSWLRPTKFLLETFLWNGKVSWKDLVINMITTNLHLPNFPSRRM